RQANELLLRVHQVLESMARTRGAAAGELGHGHHSSGCRASAAPGPRSARSTNLIPAMSVGAERPQFSQHSFPESADILAGAAHYALGRRHLESRKRVRPSRPTPSQPAQVWYGKFRVFLLPPGDSRSPKESLHS